MLVLARRTGESIIINGEIRVTILSIDGERARVGIEAPRSVPVVREEIFEAVRAENLQAAQATKRTDLLSRLGQVIHPPHKRNP